MRSTIKKLFISFSFFLGNMLTLAQVVPPPPPEPESGDIGGPAGPETPIDNYIVVLLLVAIFVIAYAHRKLKTNNI